MMAKLMQKTAQKSRKPKPQGFISIIALGIFALLMIVAINLRMVTEEAISNIKNDLNQGQAENIAFSMTGYLQWKMKNHDNGWSTGKVICGFGKHKNETTTEGGGITGFCQDPGLLAVVTPDTGKAQKDIKIELEVTGRSSTGQKLNTANCGKGGNAFNNSCYVTPIPGTGDAGDEMYCKIYKPNITVESTNLVDHSLTNNINVDQVNYSCNWNKLSFGSSQTDRVAIPLYYDSSTLKDETVIKNPFIDKTISLFSSTATDTQAKKLIVKLRTPCKPCAENGEIPNEDYQRKTCDATVKDETVCKDSDRYVLDFDPLKDDTDDIIVQWLINGECENSGGKAESCGIMPIPSETSSAVHESSITDAQNEKTGGEQFSVIESKTLAHDTNSYPKKIALLSSADPDIIIKIPTISKPLLTLFLSKPLLTPGKHNIPYLEYQVLTDQPVGNSKSTVEASIVVDGNAYKKTLTKQIKVPLIDFAVHN